MSIQGRDPTVGATIERLNFAPAGKLGDLRPVIGQLALAALYFAAAKLGLSLAFEAEQVTAVWPPTGIALAAVVLCGRQAWPAILAGAFLANVTTNEPTLVAGGIALGNLLEAVIGAWLISRFVDLETTNVVERVGGVLCLIGLAAVVSTMVSATIGVTSLCLGGVQPWERCPALWLLWWVGDATGALVFAPPLLAWGRRRPLELSTRRVAEAMALAVIVVVVGLLRFDVPSALAGSMQARALPIFPLVIWAALRFGPRGATAAILALAVLAVWGTIHDRGPFATGRIEENLKLLQVFLATVSVTGLLLAAAIAERKRAEQALVEANRRKDEFLATLAHELRNPLAPVCHALEIMQLGGDDPAAAATAREMMERQVRHMVRLIDDLLDVSRMTRGTMRLRQERVDLVTVLQNVVETSRPMVESHGHALSIALPGEPIPVDADAVRLAQVFCNLLNNACKYTPRGGRVSLAAERHDGEVVVRVRDNGIGIPAEMLTHIFEMFMQVDRSLERSHGGLGIGLTLVEQLVALHGGSVEARSEGVGRGSEFVVHLPTAEREVLPAPVAESPQPVSTPCRILVADDNLDGAQSLATLLRIHGHDVRTAADGVEACDLAAEFRPDVVLLDIGMPRRNGYETARQIRAQPWGRQMLLVALTGWGKDEDKQLSKEAGFDFHLVKPVDQQQLEAALARRQPA